MVRRLRWPIERRAGYFCTECRYLWVQLDEGAAVLVILRVAPTLHDERRGRVADCQAGRVAEAVRVDAAVGGVDGGVVVPAGRWLELVAVRQLVPLALSVPGVRARVRASEDENEGRCRHRTLTLMADYYLDSDC
jgi:hypothetical protein